MYIVLWYTANIDTSIKAQYGAAAVVTTNSICMCILLVDRYVTSINLDYISKGKCILVGSIYVQNVLYSISEHCVTQFV